MVMVGILLARLRTRVDQICFEEVLTVLLIGCVLWEIDLTSQTLASSSMKWLMVIPHPLYHLSNICIVAHLQKKPFASACEYLEVI